MLFDSQLHSRLVNDQQIQGRGSAKVDSAALAMDMLAEQLVKGLYTSAVAVAGGAGSGDGEVFDAGRW